jgi:hypothetical protein
MNENPVKPTRWIRGSAYAAAISGLLTVLYAGMLPFFLHQFEGFYYSRQDTDAAMREIQLQTRLQNYFYLLAAVFLCLALWTMSVRFCSTPNRRDRSGWLPANRVANFLIGGMVFGLVTGLGVFFSSREWNHAGRPCWDDYCTYTECIAQWLSVRTRDSFDLLWQFMRGYDHANSPMGPLLFAVVKNATGLEVTTAYQTTNLLATLGAALILWRWLIKPGRYGGFLEGMLLLLFGTNLVVVRSCFFPQTDALVLFWMTALLAIALARMKQPKLAYDVGACLLLISGLFVKLSFLPCLALIPLWRLLDGLQKRNFRTRVELGIWLAGFGRELILFVFIPVAVFLTYQHLFGLWGMFIVELHAMKMADTFFPFKVMSLIHATTFFLILIYLGRKQLGASDALLLAGAALYLLSLWFSSASGWDRFYLPLVPPLCAAAGRGLVAVQETGGARLVAIFVILAALLNYFMLEFRLFY